MKTPALFTSVSMRPKRSMAALTRRSAVEAAAMSPSMTRISASLANSLVRIERELATMPIADLAEAFDQTGAYAL